MKAFVFLVMVVMPNGEQIEWESSLTVYNQATCTAIANFISRGIRKTIKGLQVGFKCYQKKVKEMRGA